MTDDHRLLKVEILIQQQKFAEAEQFLADLLSGDPNDIYLLLLLAEVKLQQDKFDEANTITDTAIGISPDTPQLFYTKSRISIQQNDLKSAEKYIKQAMVLDPVSATHFALLANIHLSRKQFNEALEISNQALEIDPENLMALNARSTALNKLNRAEESFQTIEGALREDPNNAYTHANYGWALLEQGSHKKALEHFKEALQNDPTFHYAQAGMLEAIKAANPIYRVFLKYAFWMSNLTAKYQWAVLIGFYFGSNAIRTIARNNEALQPYLTPIIIALALIAFSTWIITPISNLFLRFNKYGKLLLDKKEKTSANFVAANLGIFALGLALYFTLSAEKYLILAAFGFAMMPICSVMFSPSKNKNSLLIYAAAMAFIGITAIVQTFLTDVVFNAMSIVFIFGFIIFQWVANFLIIKEDY